MDIIWVRVPYGHMVIMPQDKKQSRMLGSDGGRAPQGPVSVPLWAKVSSIYQPGTQEFATLGAAISQEMAQWLLKCSKVLAGPHRTIDVQAKELFDALVQRFGATREVVVEGQFALFEHVPDGE